MWREIVRQLPVESTVYLADQAHVPYGPRSASEIEALAHGITRYLLRQGAKVIVVACNTASGAALHSLRTNFPDVPFVGMEPAVKPAAERTRKGRVGVIATPTTFQGRLYRRLVDRFGRDIEIHTQVCPGLVEAIEAGQAGDPATERLIQDCLSPLLASDVDQLVLGCTHYPFVRDTIEGLVGPGVEVIDPAPAVARQVRRVLEDRGLAHQEVPGSDHRPAQHAFYTTGDPQTMQRRIATLIGCHCAVAACAWRAGDIQS